MSRLAGLSSPFLIGFDAIELALERISKGADGYPPYNVERLTREDGKAERLRVTLAVAGFRPEELDVQVTQRELVVTGSPALSEEKEFLHRGIAARRFRRSFVLADGMQILGAELHHGLLVIELERPEPDMAVRRIPIRLRGASANGAQDSGAS